MRPPRLSPRADVWLTRCCVMEPEPESPTDTLEEQDACTPESEPEPEPEPETPADDVGVGEAVGALGLDVEGALQRAKAEARRIREAEAASVDASPSPVQARPRARSPLVHVDHVGTITGAAVYDRLTDPQRFTGAHKHRFDATGVGRGLEGRDSIIKGGGNVVGAYMNGAVHDLSQITRSPRDPRSTCSARKRSQYASLTIPAITRSLDSIMNFQCILPELTDSVRFCGLQRWCGFPTDFRSADRSAPVHWRAQAQV